MTATYAKCGGTETKGCGHVWPALSGPTTMNAALDAMRTLKCPHCGQGPTGIFLASKAEIEASAAMTNLPTFHCPKWPQCGCPDGAFNDDCPAIAAKHTLDQSPRSDAEWQQRERDLLAHNNSLLERAREAETERDSRPNATQVCQMAEEFRAVNVARAFDGIGMDIPSLQKLQRRNKKLRKTLAAIIAFWDMPDNQKSNKKHVRILARARTLIGTQP